MLARASHSELEGALLLATDHAFENVSSDEGGLDHVGDGSSALLVLHALGSGLVLVEHMGDALHASHALGSSDDNLTVTLGGFVEVGAGNRDLLAAHQDDVLEHVPESLRLLFPHSDVLDHHLVVSGHSVGSVLSSSVLGGSSGVSLKSTDSSSVSSSMLSHGLLVSFGHSLVMGELLGSVSRVSVIVVLLVGGHAASAVVRLETLLVVLSMLGVMLGMLVLVSLGMFLGVLVLLGLGMSPVGMDLVVVLVSGMVEFVVFLGDVSVSSGSAGVISRNSEMSSSNLHEFVALSNLTGLKHFTSPLGVVFGDLHVLVGKFLEVFSSSGVSMGGSVEFGGVLLGVDSFVSRLTPEGVLLDSLDNSLGNSV